MKVAQWCHFNHERIGRRSRGRVPCAKGTSLTRCARGICLSMLCCLMLVLLAATASLAEEKEGGKAETAATTAQKEKKNDTKELSGMSIVGNDEAPKSLYIVPWKSSEIGVETTLNTSLNEGDAPVDRDVFVRQLEFYRVSRGIK